MAEPSGAAARGGGSGRPDACEPRLVPAGVCQGLQPSRLVPEAGIVLRRLDDSQRGLQSTTGSRGREGGKRT